MVALSLLGITMAAVVAAYLYIGRSLGRAMNLQQQETASRRVIAYFTADVSAAIKLTSVQPGQLILIKRTDTGTSTVTYQYSTTAHTLVRSEGATNLSLASSLSSLAFSYFNDNGTADWSPISVRAIELAFSSTSGSAGSGTLAQYSAVSPRVVMRNRAALQ